MGQDPGARFGRDEGVRCGRAVGAVFGLAVGVLCDGAAGGLSLVLVGASLAGVAGLIGAILGTDAVPVGLSSGPGSSADRLAVGASAGNPKYPVSALSRVLLRM